MTKKLTQFEYMHAVSALCSNASECEHSGLSDLADELISALLVLQAASDVPKVEDSSAALMNTGMH